MAGVVRPPVPMPPSQWARENLIVPDGPRANEKWDASLTPYILEPLDMIGPDSGVNEIAIMKSAQTGFTTLILAKAGHVIDRDPCRFGIVQPTDSALSDFNREKLQPAIDNTPALAARVAPQVSRAGTGSTTYAKAFPGGSLSLLLASSAADLRSKTLREILFDEIDQYPDDLDGQGDPLEIAEARQTAFLASGDWKRIYNSTPTIKGASKIEGKYEAGDKRRWHVTCPHCRRDDGAPSEFVFEFGKNFHYDAEWPHDPYYVAPCCGSIIHPHERNALVKAGRWIATDPAPGKYPSYHFDALSSPFVPWLDTVKAFVKTNGDPLKVKAFTNLFLGLPYEMKGDAPDHVRLMERTDKSLKRGHVPPRGLLLVAAADVQMRGIWLEITAFAPNGESWVVDALECGGDTSSPDGEAWQKLRRETLDREFPDAFGRMRKLDALAVDSGYRSHVVYAWVRQNQTLHPLTGRDVVLATKGLDGWNRPAIGTPSLVDIDLDGQRIKQGARVWGVGTWALKGAFYQNLRKSADTKDGVLIYPSGYCHFGGWQDENYFRQITAEFLAEEKFRGRIRRVWKQRQDDNHFLDARVYNLALTEYLGISSTTEAQWAALAKLRGLPDAVAEVNLFTAPEAEKPAPQTQPAPPPDDWLGGRADRW